MIGSLYLFNIYVEGTMYKKIECSLQAFLTLVWFVGCQWLIIFLLRFFLRMDVSSFTVFYYDHMYKITLFIHVFCLMGILIKDFILNQDILINYHGFRKSKIFVYIGYGIALWFISSLLNIGLSRFFTDYTTQVEKLFSNKETILRFLVIVFSAPLLEEYIFRGRIQSRLKLEFGRWQATLLQGIIFGVIHPLPLQKIYAIFLGISFGVIKEKEKNVQSTTIIHMAINCISWIIGTLSIV